MNIPTKYAFTFILNAALAVFVSAVLFRWHDFTDKLGGVKSFAGLVALIVMMAIVLVGIVYLQLRDYENAAAVMIRDLVIAAIAVLILAGIGLHWMSLPDGAGVKVLACLAAIAVVSGVEVMLCRRAEA